jgi:ATP-dependent exoDNAse (exonuclease V) beta subunit
VGDLGAILDRKRKQENQRLLYVAMTRAKKTLVLVDDRHLISRKKPNGSFADLLGVMDEKGAVIFNEFWQNLPEELVEPERDRKVTAEGIAIGLPQLDESAAAAAKRKSAESPVRVLPYALAEKQHDLERDERRDEPVADDAEAARHYGIWWHTLMESLDWHVPESHARVVDAHLARCPRPERGLKEWKVLCDSKLMERLVPAGAIVHREMPFQFCRGEREWVEGVMDLAIFYPSEDRWLVLDWKTNFVEPDRVDSLRELYAPQLGAYAEALRAITDMKVATGIYSTATGAWVFGHDAGSGLASRLYDEPPL